MAVVGRAAVATGGEALGPGAWAAASRVVGCVVVRMVGAAV